MRGDPRGDPPARILARFPTHPLCGKSGEVIMEAAWGARMLSLESSGNSCLKLLSIL